MGKPSVTCTTVLSEANMAPAWMAAMHRLVSWLYSPVPSISAPCLSQSAGHITSYVEPGSPTRSMALSAQFNSCISGSGRRPGGTRAAFYAGMNALGSLHCTTANSAHDLPDCCTQPSLPKAVASNGHFTDVADLAPPSGLQGMSSLVAVDT